MRPPPPPALALAEGVLGPALALSPLLIGFTGIAALLLHAVGGVLGACWLRTVLRPPRRLRPLDAALATGVQVVGWILALLPWFLGFRADPAARWTLLIAGLTLLALSAAPRPAPARTAAPEGSSPAT